ncbi:MAG: endonuclease [Acholeplasmataceae bacterium]|nr:endonuclease [Acholeplasmataceae bacterium]
MKKLFGIFAILLFSITLVACDDNTTPTHTAREVIEALEITYVSGDSAEHVTQNIILPSLSELESSARISWESGNPAVLSHTGVVTRQAEDTTVTLIVSVSLGSSSTQRFIDIVIIGTTVYHTVTFNVNGVLTTSRVEDGELVNQPFDPSFVEYRFNGWFSESTYENVFNFDTPITQDVTVYAYLEAITVANYTVKIYLENLDDNSYELFYSETLVTEIGSTVEMESTRTGFILNEEPSVTSGIVSAETELSLKAYFDRAEYTINFYDGGNLLSSETLKYEKLTAAIDDPTKDEYAFLGWSTSPVSETYYTFGEPITGNITLYAQWEVSSIYVYEGYYEGADGLTGTTLELFLRTIVTEGFVGVTYGDARYMLDDTDQDPNNSNNVILIYLGTSVSGVWDGGITWNREHVWPQSLLGASADNNVVNVASDLHNLKPANPGVNSSRGNKYFDNTTTTVSYAPRDEVKGDIARILFYMTIMYSYLDLVNLTSTHLEPSVFEMGMLNTLLQWHLQDPVDNFEINRNNKIDEFQHNRNPFIDHPEFVEKLWGPITLSDESSIFLSVETDTYLLMTKYVFDVQQTKRDYIC